MQKSTSGYYIKATTLHHVIASDRKSEFTYDRLGNLGYIKYKANYS